jgi:hypothetical protein
MMTTPETNVGDSPQDDAADSAVPPAGPAYSTPPTEGLPDANDDDSTDS